MIITAVLSEMMMKVLPVMPIQVTSFLTYFEVNGKMQQTFHHEANISLYN